jgi:hypothetical protein
MRRFIVLMSAPDEVDLTKFGADLNDCLKKYGCLGLLNEVINPLIISNNENDQFYG